MLLPPRPCTEWEPWAAGRERAEEEKWSLALPGRGCEGAPRRCLQGCSKEPPPSPNGLQMTQVPRAELLQPHSSHKRNFQKVRAAFTTPQKITNRPLLPWHSGRAGEPRVPALRRSLRAQLRACCPARAGERGTHTEQRAKSTGSGSGAGGRPGCAGERSEES